MAFEIDPESFHNDRTSDINIKVVGVGSFGCSSLNHIIEKKLAKAEFISVHSDPRVLEDSRAPVKVQVGHQFMNEKKSKKSVSSGSRSRFSIGDDDRQKIATQLQGADLIILVAGMGKGTSTTLTPAVALAARNLGILTIGLVILPFACEGKAKVIAAEEGITELRKYVDTLIVLDSDRIFSSAEAGTTLSDAFSLPNEVVYRAIKGMADILTHKNHIKVEPTETGEARALLIATGLTRKLFVQPMYGIARAGKNSFPERPLAPNPGKEPDYKTPAFIRRKIFIKALDENPLLNGSTLSRKDRINKSRPDEPAFLRLISDNF